MRGARTRKRRSARSGLERIEITPELLITATLQVVIAPAQRRGSISSSVRLVVLSLFYV